MSYHVYGSKPAVNKHVMHISLLHTFWINQQSILINVYNNIKEIVQLNKSQLHLAYGYEFKPKQVATGILRSRQISHQPPVPTGYGINT